MTQQQPEASRIVEEASIRILDELAVEGGRATRAHLFDKCQVMLWGHVVNVAARRAGYAGHDEAEVERHGKDQLFVEAVNLLLEREQIVVWDDEGKIIALHPTHRDEYIPGTNLWRSQRRIVLDEVRRPLLQLRDRHDEQSFEATLQKVGVVYGQQLRRGQLAGAVREEAIGELLALADVLFDPARLATLLGIDESEIRAAAARRHQPSPAAGDTKRHKRSTSKPLPDTRQSNTGASESKAGASESNAGRLPDEADSGESKAGSNGVAAGPLRRYHRARRNTTFTIEDIVNYLRPRGAASRSKLMGVFDVDRDTLDDVLAEFEQHYPGTVIDGPFGANGKKLTMIHAPENGRGS